MTARFSVSCLLALGATVGLAERRAAADGAPRGHDASATLVKDLDCGACHNTDGWKLLSSPSGQKGFNHAQTGFPLTGVHEKTGCTECHRPQQKTRRACATCHQDAHESRLGDSCEKCHNARRWSDTDSLKKHRMTRLPLTGMHALLDCRSCHVRQERTFTSVPADCFSCHEADYRNDAHPRHEGDPMTGANAFSRRCELCHTPDDWSRAYQPAPALLIAARAPAGHDLRFPISFGKHRAAACPDCHVIPRAPQIVSCAGCHSLQAVRMLHKGRRVASDGAGCVRCHRGGKRQ